MQELYFTKYTTQTCSQMEWVYREETETFMNKSIHLLQFTVMHTHTHPDTTSNSTETANPKEVGPLLLANKTLNASYVFSELISQYVRRRRSRPCS